MAIARAYAHYSRATAAQRLAIAEAMRILLEEDHQRGEHGSFGCSACGGTQPLAGSVEYDEGLRLCHTCATSFELARLERRVRTCAEYAQTCRRDAASVN